MNQSAKNNGNGHNGHNEQLQTLSKAVTGETTERSGGVKESFVAFKSADGLELHGALIRFTHHVVFFELYNPAIVPRFSEALDEFKIVVQGRTIYSGRAIVRNLVSPGSTIVCETTLNEEDWRNIDFGSVLSQSQMVAQEFKKFINEWEKFYKVLPDFKIIVADMRTFFSDLRIWLEQLELGIRSTPSGNRQDLEQGMTHQLVKLVIPVINEFFEKFETIAKKIDNDQKPAHGSYMRRQLHSLILSAPFAHRTFFKPRGYAGDYEMVNMIARDGYEGGSLFAKVINSWFLKQPPAVAHRNRLSYLTGKIEIETVRVSQSGRKVRIFNFACGPAIEVQNFLNNFPLSKNSEFTLTDFDSETLDYLKKTINKIKEQPSKETPVQFQKKTVYQLIKEHQKPVIIGNQMKSEFDFVYCAGLFDYLPDDTCRQLMDIFYDRLAPGGLLLATNVEPSNPLRYGMAYLLDWHLIYRTAKEIRALQPTRAPYDAVRILSDATGINLFIEVRKPADD